MEAIFKKYIWLVPALAIGLSSFFAARAANHYLESKYLPDKKPSASPSKTKAETPKKVRSKDGKPLASRNMFCSDCVVEDAVLDSSEPNDPNNPSTTSLPLQLIATNVSTDQEMSFATILNTSNSRQGSYNVGQEIPGAGEVLAVKHRFIEFRNSKNRRTERIILLGEAPPAPAPKASVATAPPRPSARPKNELMAAVDEGVKKVSDTEYELDRKVVNKVLENPAAIAKGARIVPSIKNGKSNGFKLYAIRPSSVYAKIGLKNGDTIHSINGFELSSPDKALEVYMKLREANSLSVNATRRGKPTTINYNIK